MKQLIREVMIVLAVIALAAWLGPLSRAQQIGSAIPGAIAFQYFDNAGAPLAGGKICTYQGGTNTAQSTFADALLATPQTNPVVLDVSGRPTGGQGIYLNPTLQYKLIALLGGDGTCSTGAIIWTRDHISVAGAVGSVVGTPNQITVITSGTVATISLPNNVVTGEYTATNLGSSLVFNSTNLLINGAGDISQTGVLLTHGGVNLEVGSWQGLNTLTDGGLLRGINVAQNFPGNAGGYLVFAPVTYNPYNGAVCHDIYGNLVTQPLPLPGLGSFGTNDLVMWNSTSPFMPADNSCGVPFPVNTDYGINTNGYFYARAGMATDIVAYNSFDSLRGGIHVALGATVDQAVYPKNIATSAGLNTPAAGYGGFAHQAGSIYWYYNDSTSTWSTVDLSMSGGGGGVCGADTQVQFNDAASCGVSTKITFNKATQLLTVTGTGNGVETIGVVTGYIDSAGGFRTGGTTGLDVQAPNGGMFAKAFTWSEEAAPSVSNAAQATVYADSTSHMLNWSENTLAFQKIALFKGSFTTGNCASIDVTGTIISVTDAGGACTTGGGGGTVSSSAQFNCGYYSAAGTATVISGNSAITCNPSTGTLTVTGAGVVTNGAFNSTATGGSTAFQANSGAFLVTGAGAGSFAGVVSSTGAGGGFNVTADTASTSIQTIGGIRACNASSCAGGDAIQVGTTTVITSARAGIFTALTDSAITGLTQCVQASTTGVLSGTGSACGSGGGGGVTGIVGTAQQVLANGTSGSTQTGTVTLTLPQGISTANIPTFAGVIATGAFNSTVTGATVGLQINSGAFSANGNGDITRVGFVDAYGTNPYRVAGATVIDSSRNANFALGSFGSAVTMNGGFSTGSFTNSVLYIGTSGNFYNRTTGGSAGINCSGVSDGWQAITSDNYAVICQGGSRFRAALAAY